MPPRAHLETLHDLELSQSQTKGLLSDGLTGPAGSLRARIKHVKAQRYDSMSCTADYLRVGIPVRYWSRTSSLFCASQLAQITSVALLFASTVGQCRNAV